MIKYDNFKCEDCDGEKFIIRDKKGPRNELTLHCATEGCESSYSFDAEIKASYSCHPGKRCKCGAGLLSSWDKFCSFCGKKNSNYKDPIKEKKKK